MAKTDELEDFIRLAVAKGEPLSGIESVLFESGWDTERVKRAVGRYVDVGFSVPVPKPRPFVSARSITICPTGWDGNGECRTYLISSALNIPVDETRFGVFRMENDG